MSKNRPRLGRGLSSLLSVSEAEVPPVVVQELIGVDIGRPAIFQPGDSELFHVELSQLRVNPHQPRRTFNQDELVRLAESLRQSGLIQPVVVRQVDGGYELVAGERRMRAAKLAGLTRLPALLRRVNATEQAQLALVENIHRTDLNPIDRGQAYRNLLNQLGVTQEELATRLGEDRSTVANHLRLLDLSERVRQCVADGTLSLGHAKLLAGVHDLIEQQTLAERVVRQQLSVRNLEGMIKSVRSTSPPPSKLSSAHIPDLENRLSRELQMRVQVRRSGKQGQGRLVIHYASLDQFDDLLARLKLQTVDL